MKKENPIYKMQYLPSGWYAVLDSRRLKKSSLISIERFSTQIVLWRTQSGQVVAQQDLCPHRSARLSLGRIVNDQIECPFHGFQFSKEGACEWVPEAEAKAPNICVKTYPAIERNGFIFLYYGNNVDTELPNWLTDIDETYVHSEFSTEWPMHISRCIENQLDYIHLPFVHRKTIGRFVTTKMKPRSEISEQRLMWTTDPESKFYIEFMRPNIWQNRISSWITLVLVFIPINENKTQMILRTYHKKIKLPVIRHAFGWLMNLTNRIVLKEDYSVVLSQPSEPTSFAKNEILIGSDQFIRVYRSWMSS